MQSKISVIIPVYNRTLELKRAIKSVLAQTYSNWEIWVIDDCSTVNLEYIVKEINHPDVFYLRTEIKGNANICRNIGIKNSTGEFIAMLDSDDEWLPDHLERSIETLKKLQVDGIFGSFYVNDGENLKPFLNRPLKPVENMVNYILDGNSTQTSTHFYYKEKIESVLWDENLHRHQDYDLIIRFAEVFNVSVVHLMTAIVHWRKGESRAYHIPSHQMFIEKYKNRMEVKKYLRINMENYNYLRSCDINPKQLTYFRKNILSLINQISFIEYMSCFGNNANIFKRIILRIIYVFAVLTSVNFHNR
jgi:glycosyltransferase involved in cell wall biosynthesis